MSDTDTRLKAPLLRAIFDSALDAILLADDDGVYVDANPAAGALFGVPSNELIGRRISDFATTGYDTTKAYEEFQRLGTMRGQFQLQRADGSQRTLDFSAVANVVRGLHLSILRDITDRVVAEESLRRSESLFEEAQAVAHIGSWASGIGRDDELQWSTECYRIFAVPPGTKMTAASFFALVHPSDHDSVFRASRAAISFDTPYDVEHRVLRPDGSIRWIRQRAVVERDAAGNALRLIGTVQDITEQRAIDEAMQKSEERYRRIVESTSEGVWMYDDHGVTTFMNAHMAAMLGYTTQEVIGLPLYTFMENGSRVDAQMRISRRKLGNDDRSDLKLRRKDCTTLLASIQANSLFDSVGHFDGVLALIRDVSVQRHDEEARARLVAIVESSEDAIISKNLDGIITSWNHGAELLFQYSADEVLGEPIAMLDVPATDHIERDELNRILAGEAVRNQETQRRAKDGSLVEVSLTRSPVRDVDGVIMGVSWIARDLTSRRRFEQELRRTEEKFRQAQKMEAVGRLAGGVAHDFNNLLSVILSYSEIARDELKAGDPLRDALSEIHTAGLRATELTRQLLAFSRQQVLQSRVIDLNTIVAGMERMLGRLLGDDVELTVMSGSDIGRVLADPGQIEQVIMNLAVNARDAMPDGGMVTIETSNVEFDETAVSDRFNIPAGNYVMLAVCDTGVGMTAEVRARVFEPFFTTKEQGKGTGLGLSTVIGIVQQSGGSVGVYSEPDRGSTFKVYLPRTDKLAEAIRPAILKAATGGSETILLVEDEEQVRNVACAILRRSGYHVLDASNGGEAFLIAKDFATTIHLLLTDVVMPRLSGRKLAEQLAPQRPDMKVLFISGYTDDAIVHHGVLDAGLAFLQKPFTPDALIRKVREVLDAAKKLPGALA